MAKIVLDGVLESISTRMDGTVSVKFGTNEMDSSNAASLFSLRGKYCKALFSDNNITALEEEVVDKTQIAKTGKNKTKSQRLRAVLYRCWEQSPHHDNVSFEDFYNTEMEIIIERYKNFLE
jgi:hypothetical protein